MVARIDATRETIDDDGFPHTADLREWMPPTAYKKIRQAEFIDAIPKSASRKILRKDLRSA